MNNDEIRKDEIENNGRQPSSGAPEDVLKSLSETFDEMVCEKNGREEAYAEPLPEEPAEEDSISEEAPEYYMDMYDDRDVVEADPYEQLTREEAEFLRRKEQVGSQVEMYDDTIPYEEDLPPKEKNKGLYEDFFSWAESIASAVLIICLLFSFCVRSIGVVGPSMQSTLYEGDRLIVGEIGYDDPKYGDIVIISKKSFSEDTIVKRVIATAGQTVKIDFDRGCVYVDGKLLDEPYINEPTFRRFDVQFPLTVPEGYVFVMGDNRNNSTDSRDSDIGLINVQEILGRVVARYLPLNEIKVFKRFQ